MAIYTRFGTRVKFVSASPFPVWIVNYGDRIKWHLREPERTKKTKEIHPTPVWFATVMTDDDRPDHGRGHFLSDGKGVCINEFVADDGMREIVAACEAIAVVDDKARLKKWNESGPDEKIDDFLPLAAEGGVVY